MSKNYGKDVPLTKDGLPDRRTKEGREAAAAEEGGDKTYSESSDRNRRDSPQRNLDGSIDKRTVEGRAAVAEGGDNKGSSSSSSSHSSKDSSSSSHSSSSSSHSNPHNTRSHDSDKKSSSDKSGSGEHQFDEGDHVIFNIGSNNLHGTISRVITKDQEVDGRIAHGSKDEPRYAVTYEGTGVEQIRTEGALQKDEGQSTNDAGGKYSERTGGGASSSSSSSRSSTGSGSNASPQRNIDGSIDKRTVEGRAAVAESGDNKGSSSSKDSSSSSHSSSSSSHSGRDSSSSSHSGKESSSSSHSSSQRRDDRYRKGHKFEEGETVVFHIGKHEIHGKISKVNQKSGEYKVAVGDNTVTATEKDLEHDEKSKSGSSSGGISISSGSGKGSEGGDNKFNEGDNVTFNIGLNELHGTITRVITDEDVVDGRVAHGSKDEPRYAVQYEGTGVEQIRTEGALKKDDDKMDEDKSNNKRKRDDENSKDSNKDSKEAKSPSVKEPSPKKTKSSK